jgi:hypothetical protein
MEQDARGPGREVPQEGWRTRMAIDLKYPRVRILLVARRAANSSPSKFWPRKVLGCRFLAAVFSPQKDNADPRARVIRFDAMI